GMSCRFPGANTVDEYWANLAAGVESIARFSEQDARASGVKPEFLRGRTHVRAAGVLDRIEYFDAGFFGFTPREARRMDPQVRMFLECAWEALEDAGYAGEREGIQVGVYAGANISGYLLANLHATLAPTGSVENLITLVGNDKDYLATHVSYKLNLKGPSVNVQTACSSSLVAAHMAGQALTNHECDMALAGAVTVRVPHRFGYLYEEGGILSPDGHCRAFDAAASGTVPGSGMGIVALKRLADAIEDGDHIHAVIRGSAVNNDGSLKVGFTAPSVEGQAEVIALAQAMAGVDASQIGYVEAHGTATPLGDACEIAALSQVFGAATKATGFCAIGSVKTNFGHLEAASGIAGLIKTVMALKREAIPPSLHFEAPNPEIDFAGSAFFVNTALREWKRSARARLAGVSSFGVGGTNAHLIVEEAPEHAAIAYPRQSHVLTLSAKNTAALRELAERFERYLATSTEPLGDICFTANAGRKQFAERLSVVGETAAQMRDSLQAFLRGEPIEPTALGAPSRGRRVSLPTYPFQRQRYWIELPDALDDSVYSVEWQLIPAGETRERAGSWFVVGDGEGIVAQRAESIQSASDVVCVESSCEDVLHVMQQVVQCARPPRLWLVTRGSQLTDPWQATVWGLGRVFALEHPDAWGGLIDLGSGDASALWRELSHVDREDQIALREGGRFAPRLTSMTIASETTFTASPDATYLITGGTGALGMSVAEWLIGTGARHVVLCSRGGAADVGRLEALGAHVRVAQADVADADRMAALFEEIRQSGKPLRGVVHAAGIS
ncbi:MAG TPA: type I polyketide synthase, partial [Candidatus Acidoferrum sp.]|nr:type I polyketide synthase [Candidatus Acidoferrum sp.]